MKKPIKSRQRELRQIHLIANAAGTALTGLDSSDGNISMTDTATGIKTIELGNSGFASADYSVQVTVGTAATVVDTIAITDANTFVITTVAAGDGTTDTDAICFITVTGCDVTDRY
jgi:hypothetical protein